MTRIGCRVPDAAAWIESRVFAAPVELRPYPHVIADDVLPPLLLRAIRRYWPPRAAFVREIAGNYVCVSPGRLSRRDSSDAEFWREFTRDVAPVLARACVGRFAEWVIARYGGEFRRMMVANFSLMQADPTFPGHLPHSHHYHDPLWITTLLLYIDEDAGGHQGTTINSFAVPLEADLVDYAARFAAANCVWSVPADPVDVRTSEYVANRMFAFLDSPISYHSVKPGVAKEGAARRILRMHLGAPWAWCESLYSMNLDEYRVRRHARFDTEVITWLRRDIRQVWNTSPSMPLEERREWANRLTFDF